jgi:hypothetical protein
MCSISTHLFTETTQIWGKEFPGSMFSMTPGNSSFFLFGHSPGKILSAHPIQLSQTSMH